MRKNIIAIKGLNSNNKFKYVYEQNDEFLFLDKKENATVYESVEVCVAEEKIKKILKEEGFENITLQRIKCI